MNPIAPQEGWLEANGLRLHYLERGNAANPTLLLLHGFMGHAHVWDGIAVELAAHYHVLALDQRGHGESQWSQNADYRLDDFFADIAAFAERLELDDMILIGHSMGGRNALFYAACIAERVSRLVLVDARAGSSPGSCNALRRLLNHLPLQAQSLDEIARAIQNLYPYVSGESARQLAVYGYHSVEGGKLVPKCDPRMSLQCAGSGYSVEDIRPFMQNVSCPTLIVRGEKSPFLSREHADELCRILPMACRREIPRATHMPLQENPAGFKRVLFAFLDEAMD